MPAASLTAPRLAPRPRPLHAARCSGPRRACVAARAQARAPALVVAVGKGGSGKTAAALAICAKLAAGKKVLYLSCAPDRSPELLMGMPKGERLAAANANEPAPPPPPSATKFAEACGQHVENVRMARIHPPALLDAAYDEATKADADFGVSGALKNAAGAAGADPIELPKKKTIPLVAGMDPWLLLGYILRRVLGNAAYDVVVVDGLSPTEAARLAATPLRAQWLSGRARDAVRGSDAGRVALPTLEMAASSVLADGAAGGSDYEKLKNVLDDAADAVSNPRRFVGVVVAQKGDAASEDAAARAWGALAIAGAPCAAVWMRGATDAGDAADFAPLVPLAVPESASLADLASAVPSTFLDDSFACRAPPPLAVSPGLLRFHLPRVPKHEVSVALVGSAVVVEACGQRRAVRLPPGASRVVSGKVREDDGVIEVELA